MNALIGRKVGMTRVFDEDGTQTPVTVLEVGPCQVVQRKSQDNEDYDAVQFAFDPQKESRLTKPLRGHFKKGGADAARVLREVRLTGTDLAAGEQAVGDAPADDEEAAANEPAPTPVPGNVYTAAIFDGVPFVDVTAVSKGRGFQGVVKRWNMAGGRKSHGGGNLRGPGSIGMCEFPARVLKGKKMPGQMGNKQVTVQNLKVVAVRADDNALLVRGAVPGPNGGIVMVRKALKKGGAE